MAAGFVPNEYRAILLEAITGRTALAAPVLSAGSPATATTGGALAAGTYYYKATYTGTFGETTGSNEISATTTGTTSVVNLVIGSVVGETGVKIYRGTAAGVQNVLVATLPADTLTYTDAGGTTTAATVPGTNTTAAALASTIYLGLALALPVDPTTSTLALITEVTTAGYARKLIPSFPAASAVAPIQIVQPTTFAFNALSADMTTPAYYAFITDASTGTTGKIRYIFELPEPQQGRSGEALQVPASALVIE